MVQGAKTVVDATSRARMFIFAPSAGVHDKPWVAPTEIDLDTVLQVDRPFLNSLAAESR